MKIYDKAKIDFENFKKDIEEYTKDKGVIAAFEEFAYTWKLYEDILLYIEGENKILKYEDINVLSTIKAEFLTYDFDDQDAVVNACAVIMSKFCE